MKIYCKDDYIEKKSIIETMNGFNFTYTAKIITTSGIYGTDNTIVSDLIKSVLDVTNYDNRIVVVRCSNMNDKDSWFIVYTTLLSHEAKIIYEEFMKIKKESDDE